MAGPDRDSKKKAMLRESALHKAWENTNNRLLYYRAMSSPAYLIMMFTENGFGNQMQTFKNITILVSTVQNLVD